MGKTRQMKSFTLLFLLCFSGIASAHEYFFAFAETAYNSSEKQLETTLIFSTHDIEHYLQDVGTGVKHLEKIGNDETMLRQIEALILEHFEIRCGVKKADFHLDGIEVKLNGLSNFYFHSDKIELTPVVDVRFDMLFDEFHEQQNKITFIHNSRKYTEVFLPSKPSGKIELEL